MLLLLGYQLVNHVCQVTMPTKLVPFIVCAALLDSVVQMPQPHPLHALQDTTALEETSHVFNAQQAGVVQKQPFMSPYSVLQDIFLSLDQQNV